ncbi:hypothetical protein Aca07nite_37700 [Actinoplanes capillaceus]|uniref:Uncharacterized protein n=1 Tax=Actinoplanes campanulatus TaxID=113559 RepID=A0ABQ3WJT2_9ACTN|nr:hypothetical protein [Actinoplanes capillaceus]GID46495.1 hypothetical protein Aca07nite_37700 [Actinoplanes capillaceus]
MADWIAAIGQAAGAVFTACAVVVALWIASRDARLRDLESDRKSLAQARLVLAGDAPRAEATGQTVDGFRHAIRFEIANHGDRPILEIGIEVWGEDRGRRGSHWSDSRAILLPGEVAEFTMSAVTAEPNLTISRWRARWVDADGHAWLLDERAVPVRSAG